MVKTRRPALPTRDRILAAAMEEFAARGFDGAKTDRIAQRARVNKAMLYYHFRSKAALFLEILTSQFAAVAEAVDRARSEGGSPAAQIDRFVDTLAREALTRPHFPHMWLREIADGGRHIDATVFAEFRRVLGTLAAILAEGREAGAFRQAHPFVVQLGIVAPLMFFAASAPIRARAGQLVPIPGPEPMLEDVIAYVKTATRSVLEAPARASIPRRGDR